MKQKDMIKKEMRYWTYVFGSIVMCSVESFSSNETVQIKTEYGNYRNVHSTKVFETEDEVKEYLKANNLAPNLLKTNN